MTSIRVSLSKKARKGSNDNEVFFRLSLTRKKIFRIKTNIYVPNKSWNALKEKITIPRIHNLEHIKLTQLQNRLDSLKSYLMEQIITVPLEGITKDYLDDLVYVFHYGEKQEEQLNVASTFEEIFQFFMQSQIKTEMRVRQFKCVLRMLKRYEIYRGRAFELDLNKFSDEDLIKFHHFLKIEHTFFDENGKCIKYEEMYQICPETRTPKPRGENAIFSILKRFRTFYNWALKTGRTENNPFKKYKLNECVYGTPYYLTVEERNHLFAFDFSSNPQLAIQRDIFVLQSCVGLRVGDFYRLTQKNVVNDFLEYIPSKTINESGNTVRVPLCTQAQVILKRYANKGQASLVPFISQQKYNKAIKKMLRLAGITRVVTIINPTTRKEEQRPICDVASSHMARRNFIGNLYQKTQDPDAIGAMTGHVEGSKAFSRYRTVDDNIKKNLIASLE